MLARSSGVITIFFSVNRRLRADITKTLTKRATMYRRDEWKALGARIPTNERNAPYAMKPTNPAAQNLAVAVITTTLAMISPIREDCHASRTNRE